MFSELCKVNDHPDNLKDLSNESLKICQAKGVFLVALKILPYYTNDGGKIDLRNVKSSDAKLIFDWQKNTRPPFDLNLFYNFLLMPERKIIYDNCELRFDEMIKNGALEEIKRLMSLEIPKTSPLKKALGTQQLVNYLAGKISLEEASIQAKKETRHYVKRQITWFNNQKISWNIINEKDLERIYSKIFSKISINTKSYLTHQN